MTNNTMGMYPNNSNYQMYPTYMPQNQFNPSQYNYMMNNAYQQPSQQRPNLPNAQSQMIQTSIYGRVVNNDSEITPNEVPMDGSISIFPMSDYSYIIAKQWNSDGTIKTLRFIPDVTPTDAIDISTTSSAFEEFAQNIDKRLSNIEKSLSYKKPQYKKNNKYNNEVSNNTNEGVNENE